MQIMNLGPLSGPGATEGPGSPMPAVLPGAPKDGARGFTLLPPGQFEKGSPEAGAGAPQTQAATEMIAFTLAELPASAAAPGALVPEAAMSGLATARSAPDMTGLPEPAPGDVTPGKVEMQQDFGTTQQMASSGKPVSEDQVKTGIEAQPALKVTAPQAVPTVSVSPDTGAERSRSEPVPDGAKTVLSAPAERSAKDPRWLTSRVLPGAADGRAPQPPVPDDAATAGRTEADPPTSDPQGRETGVRNLFDGRSPPNSDNRVSIRFVPGGEGARAPATDSRVTSPNRSGLDKPGQNDKAPVQPPTAPVARPAVADRPAGAAPMMPPTQSDAVPRAVQAADSPVPDESPGAAPRETRLSPRDVKRAHGRPEMPVDTSAPEPRSRFRDTERHAASADQSAPRPVRADQTSPPNPALSGADMPRPLTEPKPPAGDALPEVAADGPEIAHTASSGRSDPMVRTGDADHRPALVARGAVAQIAEAARLPMDGSVEELGCVKLSMVPGEAGLVVQILAERPETLDLLRRHVDMLSADLRDLGYSGLDFSFGHEGQNGADQATAEAAGGQTATASGRPAQAVPSPRTGAMLPDGSLDIRL